MSGQENECEDVDDDSLLHDIRLLKTSLSVSTTTRALAWLCRGSSFGILVLSLHAQAHLLSEGLLKLYIFCRNPSVCTVRFIW